MPRLALAAKYLPAGRHSTAGGDWYDVTALDDDHIGISVGDVVGHGAAAAAVMGQLRSVQSAFVLLDPWLTPTRGRVPYWSTFPVVSSAYALDRYLDGAQPYEEILLSLFNRGTDGVGVARCGDGASC